MKLHDLNSLLVVSGLILLVVLVFHIEVDVKQEIPQTYYIFYSASYLHGTDMHTQNFGSRSSDLLSNEDLKIEIKKVVPHAYDIVILSINYLTKEQYFIFFNLDSIPYSIEDKPILKTI